MTYAIAAMLFWTVFGVEHDNLGGNLDVLLIRPLSLIKSLICRKMVDTFWGQIIVTVGFIGVALVKKYNIRHRKIVIFFPEYIRWGNDSCGDNGIFWCS
mgnify:CR=1 FL=1